MLSVTSFDLIAAVIFLIGCGLLFSLRYVHRGTNPQPTNRKESDE